MSESPRIHQHSLQLVQSVLIFAFQTNCVYLLGYVSDINHGHWIGKAAHHFNFYRDIHFSVVRG